jgi:hypothetical protein
LAVRMASMTSFWAGLLKGSFSGMTKLEVDICNP